MITPDVQSLSLATARYKARMRPVVTSKKGQAYTMLILSLLTMAFFGFFALRPTLSIIARLQREIEDSRILDKALSEKIASLAKIQSDYELIRGALPLLEKALPSTPEFPQLITAIEKTARTSEASISSLTVSDVLLTSTATPSAQKTNQPSAIAFSFKVTGNYERLVRFLRLFLSNPRMVKIDAMTMTPSGRGDSVAVDISGQAKGFYYKN